jgi:hypothetical protein
MAFQGMSPSIDDDFDRDFIEPDVRAARISDIPSASKKRKEFKPFTSTLSGALLLGLYVGWASIFVF